MQDGRMWTGARRWHGHGGRGRGRGRNKDEDDDILHSSFPVADVSSGTCGTAWPESGHAPAYGWLPGRWGRHFTWRPELSCFCLPASFIYLFSCPGFSFPAIPCFLCVFFFILLFHLPSMQLYWINIFFRFSCNYKSLIEFSRLVVFVSFSLLHFLFCTCFCPVVVVVVVVVLLFAARRHFWRWLSLRLARNFIQHPLSLSPSLSVCLYVKSSWQWSCRRGCRWRFFPHLDLSPAVYSFFIVDVAKKKSCFQPARPVYLLPRDCFSPQQERDS